MPSSFYDVVILGTDLEPLLCGALLGREGLRVLVLGQGVTPPSYMIDGVQVETYPLPLTGIQSTLVQSTLELLALQQDVRQRMIPGPAGLQLLLPRHRLRLFSDPERWAAEIEREAPDVTRQAADIARTLGEVDQELDSMLGRHLGWPPETFLERRRFSFAAAALRYDRRGTGWTSWKQLPNRHPLRSGFEAALPHFSGLLGSQHSDATRARLHAQMLRGVGSLSGGWTWFRDALLSRIRSWGGDVRLGDGAVAILPARPDGHTIELARTGEEVGCTHVVHGTSVGELARLLPDREPLSALFERAGEPRSRAYRCSVQLLVDDAGVPEALAPLALYCPDPRTPERSFLLRTEAVGLDRTLIAATTLVDEHRVDTATSPLHFVRQDAMTAIRALMPFVDAHALWIDSPHDGLPPQRLRGRRKISSTEPWTRGPSTMRRVYDFPTRRALGVCALPTRTPARGVFLCNEQVAPGLGFEGAFLAATSVARIVASRYRRQDWLRRGPWAQRSV